MRVDENEARLGSQSLKSKNQEFLLKIEVLLNLSCWPLLSSTYTQEQEAYISQLEKQDRVPEGKEVVHPIPGFVIKTRFFREGTSGESEKVRFERYSPEKQ